MSGEVLYFMMQELYFFFAASYRGHDMVHHTVPVNFVTPAAKKSRS